MEKQVFELGDIRTALTQDGQVPIAAVIDMLESCQVTLRVDRQFTDAFAWESTLRGDKESDLNPVRLAAALTKSGEGWTAIEDRGDVLISYGTACTMRIALWTKDHGCRATFG